MSRKALLEFSQSHDHQVSKARLSSLEEAFEALEESTLEHFLEKDEGKEEAKKRLRALLNGLHVKSFDWKEYGHESASQVSWGDSPRADFYDDLYQDEGVALFVNGAKVWHVV